MKILVLNLSKFVTQEMLMEQFRPFGTVTSATLVMDKETGQSKRFGFVEMPNKAEGAAAVKALHHTVFLKKTIRVKEAVPTATPDNVPAETKPETAPKPAAPARPTFPFSQKPEFKFGARRREVTAKRDLTQPQYSTHTEGKPAYKPRGERTYGHQGPRDRNAQPGRFQARDGARPAYKPRGERSYGYHGPRDGNAQPAVRFPARDSARPTYKPRGERPYNRNSSGEKPSHPFQRFHKHNDTRPATAPRREKPRPR